ncbi:alpha/beta fold hydrolase [Amycolatopsis sp. lyj-109]|uniref:alpha/beta fold hydrolase n=1 Tax=Amycolatopsis sp. lyj-109 TaxID=2789287 RepID=UPI00397E85CF
MAYPPATHHGAPNRVNSCATAAGNRSAFVDFANTDQPDRSAEIPRIAVPTLVLRSAGIDGQHFARDIPGAQERVHADGGHLLPEEDPDWVLRRDLRRRVRK